jgi:hypothetical protein
METEARPLRVLWFMLHSGYLRYFGPVVQLLADRGHSVQLAFSRLEKDAGDARLARELAASRENITVGDAPLRRRGDGWRPVAGLVRSLTDLGRYVDPRYADAPALRARMAGKLTEHVRTARAVDPVTAWFTLRTVQFMDSHSSERLSRRIVSSLGAVERAIPTCGRVDEFVRSADPDVILATPVIEFGSSQVEFLKSAEKLHVPCAVSVASWDNLTGKGLIRVVPDRVFVWNEIQAREATEMHGIPADRIVATGAQKFDEWFERKPTTTRDAFVDKVGLDASRPYVLYVCSSPFIARDEVGFVRRWLARLRRDERSSLRELEVLVRPHPQNAAQWRGVDLHEAGNAVVWPPEGAQPDGGAARDDFFDSIAHSAVVVGINTSALLEAAILGKSVLAPLAPEFAGTQTGTLHFRYLLFENGGFVHTAATLDEHADQLADALLRGDEHADQTRRFVESFIRPHGLDRPAAPVLADAIEDLAATSPENTGPAVGTTVLRLLLTPAAFAAAVIGSVATRVRPRRRETTTIQ